MSEETDQAMESVDAGQLFQLGHLRTCIEVAGLVEPHDSRFQFARLLIARCLTDQGRYRQAENIYRELLDSASPSSTLGLEVRARCAFLGIYLRADISSALAQLQAILDEASTASDAAFVMGLAQDLLSRATAIGVEWGHLPADKIAEAVSLLEEAYNNYHHAGDSHTALGALLLRGKIHMLGSHTNRGVALGIFQQAYDEAVSVGNLVRQADATLRLAELYQDVELSNLAAQPPSEDETRTANDTYLQAFHLYETAGHGLGPADVLLSMGQRLINAHIDVSADLTQALQLYRQEENLDRCYSTIAALGTWYLQSGRIDEAFRSYEEITSLAEEMGYVVGRASAYLNTGDYYFRTGDYARAISYYERAEAVTTIPSVWALKAGVLALIYLQMNLPDRAEVVCRKALDISMSANRSDNVSLVLFILGQVLAGRHDYEGAIKAWRDGILLDQNRGDILAQADKLGQIGFATVLNQHHRSGSPVSEAVYQESMSLYAEALSLLEGVETNAAHALKANTYQLQAQAAILSDRVPDALPYLESARNIFANLGMEMQTAFTNSQLGLLCAELGERGYVDLFAEAEACERRALDYFLRAGMQDLTWKVRFHLADVAFQRGFLALGAEEQQEHWLAAAQLLHEAAADIESVRSYFIEPNALARGQALLGLVSDKEKVYNFAIKLHQRYLNNSEAALVWLERLKGRAFLDELSLTPLHSHGQIEDALLQSELELLAALRRSTTQAEALEIDAGLNALWDTMAQNPQAAEYVALRRGEPIDWVQLRSILAAHQSSATRG